MAINYFQQLGFDRLGQNTLDTAKGLQGIRYNEQAMQINQQNMERQQKADQAKMLQFQNEQQRARAAQGAGAFYNALNSGNTQAALQIAQQYQDDINTLGDPTFTVDNIAEMMKRPEGVEQLKQMALGTAQLAAGPEQFARFSAKQASPEKAQEATAQIKNTAEYRRYTEEIRKAVQSGDKGRAKELIAERDFFTNQVDPYARAYATGQGSGAARVQTETALTPEMVERTRQQEAAKIAEQSAAKSQQKTQKDTRAFEVYQQAAGNVQALSGEAGSGVFGLAPAVFANDRLFDGALAILRPTLKDVVREAGEGTFTEGDQKVLDQMMPTRVDQPEVRMMKLQMLDDYIRAKLGQPAAESQSVPAINAQPVQPATNQQTIGGYKIIEVR